MHQIKIGKDQYIEYNDDNAAHASFDLDALMYLHSTFPFWKALEIHCIGECCSFDAFSFGKEDVVKAAARSGKEKTAGNLMKLKQDIEARQENFCDSFFFNTSFPKAAFVQLLDHLMACIHPFSETGASETGTAEPRI